MNNPHSKPDEGPTKPFLVDEVDGEYWETEEAGATLRTVQYVAGTRLLTCRAWHAVVLLTQHGVLCMKY